MLRKGLEKLSKTHAKTKTGLDESFGETRDEDLCKKTRECDVLWLKAGGSLERIGNSALCL